MPELFILPVNVSDILSSPFVQDMDDSQFRWYFRLLCHAWTNKKRPCYLPNEDDKLRIYAGCKSKKKWAKCKAGVLSNFSVTEDDKFIFNDRLITEQLKILQIQEKRTLAGKRGSDARWQTDGKRIASEKQKMPPTPTPTPTNNKVKSQDSAFALPSWVPVIQWAAFMEIRKKKRAPNTDHALNLIVKKLDEFRARGHPPVTVLDLAIERGWQSVFEPKSEGNGNGTTGTHRDKIRFANAKAERATRAALGLVDMDSELLQTRPSARGEADVDRAAIEVLPPASQRRTHGTHGGPDDQ